MKTIMAAIIIISLNISAGFADSADDIIRSFEQRKDTARALILEARLKIPLADKLHQTGRYQLCSMILYYQKPDRFRCEYGVGNRMTTTVGDGKNILTHTAGDRYIYRQTGYQSINANREYRIFIGLLSEPLVKNYRYSVNPAGPGAMLLGGGHVIELTPLVKSEINKIEMTTSADLVLKKIRIYMTGSDRPIEVTVTRFKTVASHAASLFTIDERNPAGPGAGREVVTVQ